VAMVQRLDLRPLHEFDPQPRRHGLQPQRGIRSGPSTRGACRDSAGFGWASNANGERSPRNSSLPGNRWPSPVSALAATLPRWDARRRRGSEDAEMDILRHSRSVSSTLRLNQMPTRSLLNPPPPSATRYRTRRHGVRHNRRRRAREETVRARRYPVNAT
jgi:hypothetical protein